VIGAEEIDSLLHLYGARERRRRGVEDDHQTITEILDLGSTRLPYGLAQHREMTVSQLVSGCGIKARLQRGRIDEVSEQHRYVFAGHPMPTPRVSTYTPYVNSSIDATDDVERSRVAEQSTAVTSVSPFVSGPS
jgi:hypothetical protein